MLIAFASCKTFTKDSPTYFGGKIINPKSDYVVLFSMEKVIDTFFLNNENKFIGKIENAKEGLYHFTHGTENQYMYIEPKDSLMLRLNTWDFDESLVFAGIGAERNNFLVDCFLEDEKDNKTFYQLNKLEPTLYKQKVDSLLKLKNKTYQQYINSHKQETDGYKSILKVALTYPLYTRIEKYPLEYLYYAKSKDFPKVDNSFYNHRSAVNINKDSLMYYYPYTRYIRNYLYNKTYALGHPPMTNEYSSKFTVDLLNTIDQNIKSAVTKNAFLKQTVIGHFYRKSSCSVNENAFTTFAKLSSNTADKKVVQSLLNDNKALHKDLAIEGFSINDYNNTEFNIKEIVKDKNTFLLFWNPEHTSKSYIASRINYLSNRFSKVQFILVRIDGNASNSIEKININSQYFINDTSKANLFLTSKMSRSILIDSKGIITNGFASLSSRNVINQLKELEKN